MEHLQFFLFDVRTMIYSIKFSNADRCYYISKLQRLYTYQDNIIVVSDSFEETIYKLHILFSILKKYNLTLSPAKCLFHHTAIDYFRFHIEDHTIQPITTNIAKITLFPTLKNKKRTVEKIYWPA